MGKNQITGIGMGIPVPVTVLSLKVMMYQRKRTTTEPTYRFKILVDSDWDENQPTALLPPKMRDANALIQSVVVTTLNTAQVIFIVSYVIASRVARFPICPKSTPGINKDLVINGKLFHCERADLRFIFKH